MYNDDQLKQFRRNFLRGNRPEEFHRLKREGQLEAPDRRQLLLPVCVYYFCR